MTRVTSRRFPRLYAATSLKRWRRHQREGRASIARGGGALRADRRHGGNSARRHRRDAESGWGPEARSVHPGTERFAAALRALGARIRAAGAPSGLSFDCTGAFFRRLPEDPILNLTTVAGDLDLAFRPSDTQGYADLERDAAQIEAAEGVRILVASLADVVRSKEAANREKDRMALPRLRRLRDRTCRQQVGGCACAPRP